jgi:hypothetical protein
MRELVRRGAQALPVLIAHLEDKRSSKLSVGGSIFHGGFYTFQLYQEEYDPRSPTSASWTENMDGPGFTDPYVVKVGDLCYAIIGQIVNRNFLAVRYQPTGGLIVNSPIERPDLAGWVRRDWGNLDAQKHQASLLADVESSRIEVRVNPALARLRFYYPMAYQALTGESRRKRDAFELGHP